MLNAKKRNRADGRMSVHCSDDQLLQLNLPGWLAEVVVCPQCKADLRAEQNGLVCRDCRAGYPVRDGLPVFTTGASDNEGKPAKKAEITRYYDNVAPIYNVSHGIGLYGGTYCTETKYKPVFNRFMAEGDTILEIGCGTGVFTRVLGKQWPRLVATDISEPMLRESLNAGTASPLAAADTERLPFADNAFDVVVGMTTFSYCPDKPRALSEIQRVLKPGGRFVNIDMNYLSPIYYLLSLAQMHKARIWTGQLIQSNRWTLRRLYQAAGLEVVYLREASFIPHGLSRRVVRILAPIDKLLEALPVVRSLGMRVIVVGRKPS